MFVVESALDPPGPIPNPVVTQRSAGEYWVGDCPGGEAAASIPPSRPQGRGRAGRGAARSKDVDGQAVDGLSGSGIRCGDVRRGVEQWQLVGLITQRSEVRILPPLPKV